MKGWVYVDTPNAGRRWMLSYTEYPYQVDWVENNGLWIAPKPVEWLVSMMHHYAHWAARATVVLTDGTTIPFLMLNP